MFDRKVQELGGMKRRACKMAGTLGLKGK